MATALDEMRPFSMRMRTLCPAPAAFSAFAVVADDEPVAPRTQLHHFTGANQRIGRRWLACSGLPASQRLTCMAADGFSRVQQGLAGQGSQLSPGCAEVFRVDAGAIAYCAGGDKVGALHADLAGVAAV